MILSWEIFLRLGIKAYNKCRVILKITLWSKLKDLGNNFVKFTEYLATSLLQFNIVILRASFSFLPQILILNLIGCYSTLSDYFIWTVIRRLVPVLSRPFREAEAKYKRVASHIKAEPARWLTCIKTTNYHRGLTFATGSLYIEKAFDKKMIPLVCFSRFNFSLPTLKT